MDNVLVSAKRIIFYRQIVLVVFLWISVLGSSLTVIYLTHDIRNKFNELEELRVYQDELRVIWGQYLLEKSTWASYMRIEKIATEQLSMQIPRLEQMVIVTADE